MIRSGPAILMIAGMVLCGCVASEGASERSARRSYDGAPPMIPHELFGIDCVECHSGRSVVVEGYASSPAMPHDQGGWFANCKQCHVPINTDRMFRASVFEPLRQDLRAGDRAHPGAPPVIPHKIFMRENCLACHFGEGIRPEIRVSHPERTRCRQCHVAAEQSGEWIASGD